MILGVMNHKMTLADSCGTHESIHTRKMLKPVHLNHLHGELHCTRPHVRQQQGYSKSNKIRIGGNINVFYNPNKPEEHFTKGGGFILPFLGIMMIIVGAICIYSGLQL